MKIKKYNEINEQMKIKYGYIDELDEDDKITDIVHNDYGTLYYQNKRYQIWLQLEESDIAIYFCNVYGDVSDIEDLLSTKIIMYNEKEFDILVTEYKDLVKNLKELFKEHSYNIKKKIITKIKAKSFNL